LLKELSAGLMVVPGEEEARETIQDISLAAYHALSPSHAKSQKAPTGSP
jgi:hypothetical protein